MIEFRKATVSDAEELARIRGGFLAEINNRTDTEEISAMQCANRAYLQNALAESRFVAWLATDGEAIVATSGLSFSEVPPSFSCPDGRVAYIMNMFTLPDYRKQGIAYELFSRIVEEAKVRGYTTITLNATSMGRPLYERYGFQEHVGEMIYYVS